MKTLLHISIVLIGVTVDIAILVGVGYGLIWVMGKLLGWEWTGPILMTLAIYLWLQQRRRKKDE